MVAFNLKSNETDAQMEERNQKCFDGEKLRSEANRHHKQHCSISNVAFTSIMGFTFSVSRCNKWDLLLGFIIFNGLLIFADGYSAIEVPEEEDIMDKAKNQFQSSTNSDNDSSDLLKQAQHMCRLYTQGTFQVAPCIWCECTSEGNTKCWAQTCPQDSEPDCIKYTKVKGECCPVCVEYGCKYNGDLYKRGESIPTHDVCKKCYCPWDGESGGNPVCMDLHCPNVNCVDSHIPTGKCCPICPNGPNCWLKEHKLIIPTGRQVWVDKCHVCYCPSDNKTETNNVDVSLDTFIKQSNTMPRIKQPSDVKDSQHAVCVYEKSYACDEEK